MDSRPAVQNPRSISIIMDCKLISIPVPLFLFLLLTFPFQSTTATDPVYVRSNSYGQLGQLVTSSTLRWVRGRDTHAVTLESGEIICRVSQSGLRQVGLLSSETGECNTNTEEDPRVISSSRNYQTLSGVAAQLKWAPWERPNPPPTASVSISDKVQKFIASPAGSGYGVVGYMDPRQSLGSAIFPNSDIPLSTSARILTEVEPERYELYDIDLRKAREFIEEEVVLARGRLRYDTDRTRETETGYEYDGENVLGLGDGDDEESEYEEDNYPRQSQSGNRQQQQQQRQVYHVHGHSDRNMGRIESVLSYETEGKDYWGNGNLMVKGLPTHIQLPSDWQPNAKTIEWGLPVEQLRRTETMTISADLLKETGVSVTIKGTRMEGEMTYWATLKTFYKDGSSATRLIEGVRRLNEVNNIHMVLGRPYFIANGSLVPEPTTTTTTTTTPRPTSSSSSSEASSSARGERDKMFGDGNNDNSISRADKSTSSSATGKHVVNVNSSMISYLVTLVSISILCCVNFRP